MTTTPERNLSVAHAAANEQVGRFQCATQRRISWKWQATAKGYSRGRACWTKPGRFSILLRSGKILELHLPAGAKTSRETLERELSKIPAYGSPVTWRKAATFRAQLQLDLEAAI
jgi:hypothetical protein